MVSWFGDGVFALAFISVVLGAFEGGGRSSESSTIVTRMVPLNFIVCEKIIFVKSHFSTFDSMKVGSVVLTLYENKILCKERKLFSPHY